METVTDTWSRVRQLSLTGMNSSKWEISSGVAATLQTSTTSTKKIKKEHQHMLQNKEKSQTWQK